MKKWDLDYSLSVETSFRNWAKPFVNGNIKTFFIPGVRFGREIVELCQRCGIDYETVTIDRDWDLNKWGIGEFYGPRCYIWDFKNPLSDLEAILVSDAEFDVLCIPSVNGWAHFTKNIREAIERRVRAGAGLVLINPFDGLDFNNGPLPKTDELKNISPLGALFEEGWVSDIFAGDGFPGYRYDLMVRGEWTAEKHFITRGIPFEIFPYGEIAVYPHETRGETIISLGELPVAAVSSYGAGRTCAFGYYPRSILPQHADFTGREAFFECVMDHMKGSKMSTSFNYLEYFYALIFRAIIWAAKREPKNEIIDARVENNILILETTGGECLVRVLDIYDNIIYTAETGEKKLRLSDNLKTGGDFRCEILLYDGGAVSDFYTVSFNHSLKCSVAEINGVKDCYDAGDLISAEIVLSGELNGRELLLEITDGFDRVLFKSSDILSDNADKIDFNWKIIETPSIHVKLTASLYCGGFLIHKLSSADIVVTNPNRNVSDFEVLFGAQNRGQGDFIKKQREILSGLGASGGFPESNRLITMCGSYGMGVYWYHRHQYTARKEKYIVTGDKSFLTRVPCFNDPSYWEENARLINENVKKTAKFGPISYMANDEGSLTCYNDEQDICFCPFCMETMRDWLREKYGSINKLNAAWESDFTSWDECVPLTRAEARKTGKYGSFGDHRAFMDLTYALAYKKIGEITRNIDPDARLYMSGCQNTTAYTGYDYYLLHKYVGQFDTAYGFHTEIQRSFAKKDSVICSWIGYGARGQILNYRIWRSLIHGINLFMLFTEYSHVNPDFTLYRGAVDTSKIISEIRGRGYARLLSSARRESLGIAVHYSMPSVRGANLLGKKQLYADNQQKWADILEGLGYQYNVVSSNQIEEGVLITDNYKILILPFSAAIGERECGEIKKFVKNGGTVLADAQTAIMDENTRLLESGRLDDVFGIKRYSFDTDRFYNATALVPNPDFKYFYPTLSEDLNIYAVEGETRAEGGLAGYLIDFNGRTPCLVVNEYGNGRGVYLNFFMNEYTGGDSPADMGLRETVSNIFRMADIKKLAEFDSSMNCNYEFVYYDGGGNYYIAAQRFLPAEKKIGMDGLDATVESDSKSGADALAIQLPFAAHLYDMRGGVYLGYSETARLSIMPGDVGLLAALPYSISKINLSIPDETRAGSFLRIKAAAETSKKPYAPPIFAINVQKNDGSILWEYCRSYEAPDGVLETEIFLPYNMPRECYQIIITDAATGVSASTDFTVI